MRPLLLLLCATIFACRTSDLGTCAGDGDCSTNAICDLAQRVCVQTDAPEISNVAVTTAPGYSGLDGGIFFDTSGAPLAVSATIASRGGAAVDPASVCLKIAGETGACAHPGVAGTGNTFTFSLPRPAGPASGTSPLAFTVSAAAASGHVATSAAQNVYFDNQPPDISIASDPAAYARTLPDGGAPPILVSATITDGSAVSAPRLLSGGKTLTPSAPPAGNVFTFQLDPRDAPAGVEGPYAFQVAADDPLGHSRQVGGSRKIDDAPPSVAVQIYKDVPDGGGVTYPAAVANTGWTGATFVYGDTVHVSGTITDLSGVASASLRVDGIELDGGVATGALRSLGCTAGTTSCPFSLDITLNDAGVPFHTGASTFDAGVAVGFIPAADLQFAIVAQDSATASGGAQSPRSATSTTGARTTRLLWQTTLAGSAVSGLAVHPDGDLIVTLDGGTGDTVFALAPDQPTTRWGATLTAFAASEGVIGAPAIGAGDGGTARIYVAGALGDFYAFEPDGGAAWTSATISNSFVVSPAVTQVTIASNVVDQIVLPDGMASPNSGLWRATSAADVTSVTSDNRDFHAAPMILGGNVYFASQSAGGGTTHVTRHTIAANGTLGAAVTSNTNGGVPYFGFVTDGTRVYVATRPATGPGVLLALDPAFINTTQPTWSTALTAGLTAEPTFGIDGKLYGADLGNTTSTFVSTFDPATGTKAPFLTLAGNANPGLTPLQGSDGHLYLPRRTGLFDAYEGSQLSWTFDPPGAILRYATMDCQGRLFAASGATVYAFLTDDRGLADTPWPSLRRDARNTGNAGALKYGVRTVTGCTQ
jgi:hypothetical protein